MPALNQDEWMRLPGLFRRWELDEAIEVGDDYYFEEAGSAEDGSTLYAIYQREFADEETQQ